MNSVNAAIRTLDLELVKGDAYFYFAGLGENAARVDLLDNTSVYTPFLTDLSLCEWEDEALLIAERVENFDA